MKQKRKENMDNQPTYQPYSNFKSNTTPSVQIATEDKNLLIKFEDNVEYDPTPFLLKSIVKGLDEIEEGETSPIFSSAEETRKWFEEQDE